MKQALKIVVTCFFTAQLYSCVIINPGRYPVTNTPVAGNESLETWLARFPLLTDANWLKNSLHITVVNPKKKTIAEIYFTGDTLAYMNGDDQLIFKLDVRDFDKTTVLSAELICPLYLVKDLSFTKAEDGYYKMSSKETDSAISCLIKSTITPLGKNEMLYSYTGSIINEYGTEVSYWGQGDPPPLKTVFAALAIASTASENMRYVLDICNTTKAIENAKKNADCKNPGFKIVYYPRPLAKVFYKPIYADFYRDCKAEIICPKK